ncbi:hypothetical protein A4G19_11390 [Pasteurellaceae bacterium Macca]|nr:hypothetical protein [Pasteurellaceae bacterium Macca]
MKILSKLSILFFATLPLFAQGNPLSISEGEINHYLSTRLSEKVPLSDSIGIPGLFQLDYRLHNLSTQIGRTTEKRVAILGDINGKLRVRGKKYDADIRLNFDTIPFYDPQTGSLYLRDIRLNSWQATPEKYQAEMQTFLPLIVEGLSQLLNTNPVYTLDESKAKEALIKKFGKAVVVENGELRLEASIF